MSQTDYSLPQDWTHLYPRNPRLLNIKVGVFLLLLAIIRSTSGTIYGALRAPALISQWGWGPLWPLMPYPYQ